MEMISDSVHSNSFPEADEASLSTFWSAPWSGTPETILPCRDDPSGYYGADEEEGWDLADHADLEGEGMLSRQRE